MNRDCLTLLGVASLAFGWPLAEARVEDYSLEQLSALARNSTVFMTVSHVDPNNPSNICDVTAQGTAFIISSEGYALSASHNLRTPKGCEDYTELKIEGRIGYHKTEPPLPLIVIGRDDHTDAAILKFAQRADLYEYAPICNFRTIKPGKALVAFGFPKSSGFAPLPTTYSNPGGLRWQASSDFTHGVSGGPVYSYSGQVVGIVQGGLKNTPAVRYIVPLSHAVNLISRASVSLKDCSMAPESKQFTNSVEVKSSLVRIKILKFERMSGSQSDTVLEDWGGQWITTEISKLKALPFKVSLEEDENENFLLKNEYYVDQATNKVTLNTYIIYHGDQARLLATKSYIKTANEDSHGLALKLLAEEIGVIISKKMGLPTPRYPMEIIVLNFEIFPKLSESEQDGLKSRVRYSLHALNLSRLKIVDSGADLLLGGKVTHISNETGCLKKFSAELDVKDTTQSSTLVFGLPLDIALNDQNCAKLKVVLPNKIAEVLEPQWKTRYERKDTP